MCNCLFNFNILPLGVSEILGGPILDIRKNVPAHFQNRGAAPGNRRRPLLVTVSYRIMRSR